MGAVRENLIENRRKIYFVGIAGVGMSALARVLKSRGYEVAGSDSQESKTTSSLREAGIPVFTHGEESVASASDLLVFSSAIAKDNRELAAARRAGVRICHRAELLASLMNSARTSVGITGTHGKTTTSSMTSFVLSEMGLQPTCFVGGDLLNFGSNALSGNSDLCVAEVDESDKSHELYALNYAVITNLEQDHVENYGSLDDLRQSFERFVANMKNPGLLVYSGEDSMLTEIIQGSGKPCLSTGFSPLFDFSAANIEMNPFGSEFDLLEVGFFSARIKLGVPGRHNIANALMTLAVLAHMGLDLEEAGRILARFRGARRRLELKGQFGDLFVIDDYAHHPTEVRASIAALKSMGKQVTVIFQPHRYSRTAFFFKGFAAALAEADQVIVTDIYSAGEVNTQNVDADLIYHELLKLQHPHVQRMTKDRVIAHLQALPELRGVVAFLGAGNIGGVADEFASRLKNFAAA